MQMVLTVAQEVEVPPAEEGLGLGHLLAWRGSTKNTASYLIAKPRPRIQSRMHQGCRPSFPWLVQPGGQTC